MRLILIGPPGAGKGTLAAGLIEELSIPHISTGDMFRAHLHSGDALGVLADSYISKGQLVPDSVVIDMVRDRLTQSDCQKGFLLDGFPRTVPQGEALDTMLGEESLGVDAVVLLQAEDDFLVQRLSLRRVCASCGAVYHLANKPSKREGVCDVDGGELIHRSDDREDVIRERLAVYRRDTAPLVAFYGGKGLLQSVDGSQNSNVVLKKCIDMLRNL